MNKILILVICFITMSVKAQTKSSSMSEDYFGIYKGDLKIMSQNGVSTIPMELHLLPTDDKNVFIYTIVYIVNDKRQERKYTLKRVDRENGLFEIDENNGIVLNARVWDNKLYSMYEVEGSLLTTQLTFENGTMIFEITFTKKESAVKSGTEGEKPIEVLSYPITTIQKGILKKQ